MGRVTLHISDEDYQLFHHYCANYCRLHDETRKNSIKILLELYKHQIIDIQEHCLDNIFTFFTRKNRNFRQIVKSLPVIRTSLCDSGYGCE